MCQEGRDKLRSPFTHSINVAYRSLLSSGRITCVSKIKLIDAFNRELIISKDIFEHIHQPDVDFLHPCRAVKEFLSSGLIMNSRQLWNSHQRQKVLRAEASWDILKFRVSEMPFPLGFQEVFSTAEAMLFSQNTCKTGKNAVEMSQAFHNITRFECFTDLNLFKYAFNVIQNWETEGLQILFNGAYWYFLLAVMVAGDESSRLRMANKPAVLAGYQPLLAALIHQPEVDLYGKNILCHPVTRQWFSIQILVNCHEKLP